MSLAPWTARRWAAIIQRILKVTLTEDVTIIRSEGGNELLVSMRDPTGPNGGREFLVTIKEV